MDLGDPRSEIQKDQLLLVHPDVEWCAEQSKLGQENFNPVMFPWIAKAEDAPDENGLVEITWPRGSLLKTWHPERTRSQRGVKKKIPVKTVIIWGLKVHFINYG